MSLPSVERTATGESGPIIDPETEAPSSLRAPFSSTNVVPRTTAPGGFFSPAWTLSGPVLGAAPCAPNTPTPTIAAAPPAATTTAAAAPRAPKTRFMHPPLSTASTVRVARNGKRCPYGKRHIVGPDPSRSASDPSRTLGRRGQGGSPARVHRMSLQRRPLVRQVPRLRGIRDARGRGAVRGGRARLRKA